MANLIQYLQAGPCFPGVPLTGLSFPRVKGDNLSTGDNDLYTVPTGKRLMFTMAQVYNASAGNITWFFQVKVSGTYYRITSSTTTATNAAASATAIAYIAEAGEILSINTATTNALNVVCRCYEYDASVPIYSPKVLSLSNGDNTVYTVPSGKTAILMDGNGNPLGVGSGAYINDSGGSRSIIWYAVNSGGSAATTNKITPSLSVNDDTRSSASFPVSLNAGDFLVINTNSGTTTQSAFVNIMEIAA